MFETPKDYYVYLYLDEDNIPYYVGMGKGRRALQKHVYVDVPPHDRIEIRSHGLTEQQAWDLETNLINEIGRECLSEGPLKNLAPGGMRAKSGWNHSEVTKQQISESLTGRVIKDTANYKQPKSAEHAENIRKARLGTTRKSSTKNKISATKINQQKRWYTDGVNNLFCCFGQEPTNYRLGRTTHWFDKENTF